ncbi:MAG: D-alanyl-D-alanine carboxypeptidase family protein [Clostridia bacterium]|nr:D-alanyl-D-alanine carboxypeptidase family protein [Clostridia bacterium]
MSSDTSVATVDGIGNIYGVSVGECKVTVSSVDNPAAKAEVTVHVAERPKVEGATYIQGILVVNKTYALPADYSPGVDPEAQTALDEMFAAAAAEGVYLRVDNGFRSYDLQSWLYNYYVSVDGKAAADTYSARPGHSEHQTGLAFDLYPVSDSFAYTAEGIWTNENCWKYGFIIRYPQGKESITGFKYEPWHIRYLGKEIAKKVHDSGLCLEEYLGIDSVYSY